MSMKAFELKAWRRPAWAKNIFVIQFKNGVEVGEKIRVLRLTAIKLGHRSTTTQKISLSPLEVRFSCLDCKQAGSIDSIKNFYSEQIFTAPCKRI